MNIRKILKKRITAPRFAKAAASKPKDRASRLRLHNTLSGSIDAFSLPGRARYVRMYNCGPTVYGEQHIGNLSMFVFADVLRKALEHEGFKVKQVINITDFGHLTGDNEGDADLGEDRMTKGLKREGLEISMENMRAMAERYAKIFIDDISRLNVPVGEIEFPRASAYVSAQIAMIQTLVEKGYAYQTSRGVYFETGRFRGYGALGHVDLAGQVEGARVAVDGEKRGARDFVLWKSDKKLGWESPWGKGFPGWHIECSAMIRSILGEQIDIHTGGIEHIPIHHNNEIAQSEAATGRSPFSRFWLHRAHIQIESKKIAKSENNVVYLKEIIDAGYHPLALRYLFLGAHYRTSANFSWEALQASQNAYGRLLAIAQQPTRTLEKVPESWSKKFYERVNDDLDIPGALAVLWEMTKDSTLSKESLVAALYDFDSVLGLTLRNPDAAAQKLAAKDVKAAVDPSDIPERVANLLAEREAARDNKAWNRADELRQEIEAAGYLVEDSAKGARLLKKPD